MAHTKFKSRPGLSLCGIRRGFRKVSYMQANQPPPLRFWNNTSCDSEWHRSELEKPEAKQMTHAM